MRFSCSAVWFCVLFLFGDSTLFSVPLGLSTASSAATSSCRDTASSTGRTSSLDRVDPLRERAGQYRCDRQHDRNSGGAVRRSESGLDCRLVMLPLLLLVGEVTPKTIAVTNPRRISAGIVAGPLRRWVRFIGPLRWVVRNVSDRITTWIVGRSGPPKTSCRSTNSAA